MPSRIENKTIVQLPLVPDINGSWIYVMKDDMDYKAPLASVVQGSAITYLETGPGLVGGPIYSTGQIALSPAALTSLAKAESALQPGSFTVPATSVTGLSVVATTGNYLDLLNRPLLGTMAAQNASLYTPTAGLGSAAFSPASAFEPAHAKGSVIAGTGVSIAGSTTNRLVGAGDIVISSSVVSGTGSLIEGSNVTLTGTLANRLIGAGDVTVQANGGGNLIAGAGVALTGTLTNRLMGPGNVTITASGGGGGTGTVTSVNLGSSVGLTASGGPVTTSGTLTYTLSPNLQAWNLLAPATKADLASPAFTGNPTATTQSVSDNSTRLATTAFVKSAALSNPMNAAGDIIVGGSSGTPQRLPAGSNGTVLTMSGGTQAWNSVSAILGYTPANKAGDTFTGNIAAPEVYVNGLRMFKESTYLRLAAELRAVNGLQHGTATGSTWLRVPRIFVGGSDPGAEASDGDLWIT